ncbi:MAG: hypothetical protein ABJE95_30190 [Byssovorax sp.]
MEIKTDVSLSFPRARIFKTYRDRLEDIAPHLPNIRAIKVSSREERPSGDVYLVNEWAGGGDIPAVARAILSESMLSWTDHATWKEATFSVEWKTVVHAFPGALESSGVNRFIETPTGTMIQFRGTLVCDASKVPGVPRLLARSLNGTIEKLFVSKIAENLVAVGQGVGKLLAVDDAG